MEDSAKVALFSALGDTLVPCPIHAAKLKALENTEKKSPGFPVAEHSDGLQNTVSDAEICGIKLCTGNNIYWKRRGETHLQAGNNMTAWD